MSSTIEMRLDIIEKANTIEMKLYDSLWWHAICTYIKRIQSVMRVQNTAGIELEICREYRMRSY